MRLYLVIDIDGLSQEDNPLEIQGRVERNLNELFAHERRYYNWLIGVEEFDEPVEKARVCLGCGLKRSLDEALNTGSGVYRP